MRCTLQAGGCCFLVFFFCLVAAAAALFVSSPSRWFQTIGRSRRRAEFPLSLNSLCWVWWNGKEDKGCTEEQQLRWFSVRSMGRAAKHLSGRLEQERLVREVFFGLFSAQGFFHLWS